MARILVGASSWANHSLVKESAWYQLPDRALTKAKKSATNFAFVPETNASVQLCWYPIEGIQMKVGWNFLAFFDTVQADQQVDFDFRSLDPNWKNRFVRFHSFQNIFFNLAWIVLWIALSIIGNIPVLGWASLLIWPLIGLGGLVVWVVLLLKAYQGQMFKLPVIGNMAEKQANG